MDATELSVLAGAVLSFVFSYVPGLNTKFAAQAPEYKRLIMLGVLAVAAVAVYGVSCLGWFDVGIACTKEGAISLLQSFVVAAVANQTAYQLSPQTAKVRAAKA